MVQRQYFIIFFIISIALHVLFAAALLLLSHLTQLEEPVFTPVKVVNLPKQKLKQLPPIQQPPPVTYPPLPERRPLPVPDTQKVR